MFSPTQIIINIVCAIVIIGYLVWKYKIKKYQNDKSKREKSDVHEENT